MKTFNSTTRWLNQLRFPAITQVCVCFTLILLVFYFEELSYLHYLWTTNFTYNHGYLILFVAFYILLKQSKSVDQIQITPYPSAKWAFIPLTVIGLIYLFGSISDIQTIKLIAIVLWLPSFFTLMLGNQMGLKSITPTLLLSSALPFWQALSFPLQTLTVFVVGFMLDVFNIPAYIEDTYITIPGGIIQVEEGCSGLRYLLTSFCLIFIVNTLFLKKRLQQILFCVVTLAIALFTNWVRVLSLTILGYHTQLQHSLLNNHNTFGWVLFVLFLLPIFYSLYRLPITSLTSSPHNVNQVTTKNSCTQHQKLSKRTLKPKYSITALIFGILIIASPTIIKHFITNQSTSNIGHNSRLYPRVQLPQKLGNWNQVNQYQIPSWAPEFQSPDQNLKATYQNQSIKLSLHILSYYNQHQNKELINQNNHVLEPNKWKLQHQKVITIAINQNQKPLKIISLQALGLNDQIKLNIFYWYSVNQYNFINQIATKVTEAGLKLSKQQKVSSLIALSSFCDTKCDLASEQMTHFIQQNYKTIKAFANNQSNEPLILAPATPQ